MIKKNVMVTQCSSKAVKRLYEGFITRVGSPNPYRATKNEFKELFHTSLLGATTKKFQRIKLNFYGSINKKYI